MALGEYRGPSSAGALMRYVGARCEAEERAEAYRVYMSECMRALVGGSEGYYAATHPAPDFDAEKVVDEVIERARLEVK